MRAVQHLAYCPCVPDATCAERSRWLVQGLVISCCLVCAVLFGSAAYDYVHQYWVAIVPPLAEPAAEPQQV